MKYILRISRISILLLLVILNIIGCTDKIIENGSYDNLPGNLGRVAENSENYFVILESGRIIVMNKKTGKVFPACRNATCPHQEGTCAYNHGALCIKNYNGKILLSCDEGTREIGRPIIYELNPDTYELTIFKELEEPFIFFEIYKNYLIYSYFDLENEMDGWNLIDLNTGEKRQLLDRNSTRPFIGIQDRFIYLTTTELELYRVNLDNSEKELIVKNCMDAVLYEENFYYNRYNAKHGNFDLWSVSMDGSHEKKVIDNINAFQTYDNHIFYLDGSKQIFKTDLNGKAKQLLAEGIEDTNFLILPEAEQVIASTKDDFTEYIRVNFDGSNREIIFSGND